MRIAISQPMYFPWRGIFEQIKLVDVFVHYDDVALPQGRSFMNRVQLKTPQGFLWMTIPLARPSRQSAGLNMVQISKAKDWREAHKKSFQHNYARAPYGGDAGELLSSVLASPHENLAELCIRSIESPAVHMGLNTKFVRSSTLGVEGKSSERVLKIVKHLGGDTYVTGHGAKNYLDCELFERNNIRVEFMDYKKTPYPQLWGEFNPHVSILDLIANTGQEAVSYLDSGTIYWREFLNK